MDINNRPVYQNAFNIIRDDQNQVQQIEIELGGVHQPEIAALPQQVDQIPGIRLSTIYSIRLLNCFMVVLILPILIFLIVVLSLTVNDSCTTPLKLWALVQVVIDGLLLFNHVCIIIRLPWFNAPPHEQFNRILGIRSNTAFIRLMHMCWFSWYVVGMVWVFQAMSDGSCPSKSSFLYWSIFSVLMFHSVVAVFSVLFCGLIFVWSVIRTVLWRATNRVIYMAPVNRGVTPNEIEQLTTSKKFEHGMIDEESAMCAICLDSYDSGAEIRELPCSQLHHFHKACIDQWLVSNRSCPLCKKTLEGTIED